MQGECLPARCSAITLSIRTGLGGLDGGENHEGKRREEKKENILLAWKVRSVDACKYRYEASAMACWVRLLLLG